MVEWGYCITKFEEHAYTLKTLGDRAPRSPKVAYSNVIWSVLLIVSLHSTPRRAFFIFCQHCDSCLILYMYMFPQWHPAFHNAELGDEGARWNDRMLDEEFCQIVGLLQFNSLYTVLALVRLVLFSVPDFCLTIWEISGTERFKTIVLVHTRIASFLGFPSVLLIWLLTVNCM